MARKRLSKSEIKALNLRLAPFGLELEKRERVELVEDGLGRRYEIGGEAAFLEEERLIPHLKLLLRRPLLKAVTVDMGAVPFMAKGADVMRPGVTAVEEGILAGELVRVVDERHGKALAVGEALMESEAMRAATEGKVVATRHWIGDKAWQA